MVDGGRVSVDDFVRSFIDAVKTVAKDEADLRSRWADLATREELFKALAELGFNQGQLMDVHKIVARPDCDVLDVMLDLVYGVEPVTKAWRASHLEAELAKMNPARRAFAEEILKNYVKDGVWSLERATLHNYLKMKYGSIDEGLRSLECANASAAVDLFAEFQECIYV